MLGEILAGLADAATAEQVLAQVAPPRIRDRIAQAAAARGDAVGALVAARIRDLVDHGNDELWLHLIGAMAGSPQPAAAVVDSVLALTFPDPVRVQVTRSGAAPG